MSASFSRTCVSPNPSFNLRSSAARTTVLSSLGRRSVRSGVALKSLMGRFEIYSASASSSDRLGVTDTFDCAGSVATTVGNPPDSGAGRLSGRLSAACSGASCQNAISSSGDAGVGSASTNSDEAIDVVPTCVGNASMSRSRLLTNACVDWLGASSGAIWVETTVVAVGRMGARGSSCSVKV